MSFLRRISNAAQSFLPSAPSSSGTPAPHVPRRATETFRSSKLYEIEDEEEVASRASWELSDGGSYRSGSSSSSSSRSSLDDRRSYESGSSEDDTDSEDDMDQQQDRFDMMTRHLWNVAERQGWFRDARSDGLVTIR
jgi:hypothetical protein